MEKENRKKQVDKINNQPRRLRNNSNNQESQDINSSVSTQSDINVSDDAKIMSPM